METPLVITKIERVDDTPLLLEQLKKMEVASLLDKHFQMHGNWQGLSLGQVTTVWLAYIMSEGDHRLNAVQGWVAGLLETLRICTGAPDLRELDFSDDRLCRVLDCLGEEDADAAWDAYESEQNGALIRVYDLKVGRVRIDSTTAKSYVTVTEGGLFQFGHSKEHRPDLPQLKINMATLDPLGLPLSTTIVSGQCADDPLYVPEIRRVQASVGRHGVLYVGDCKMAAQDTRAYIAASQDHYLCPLSAVQMPAATLQALLAPVWTGAQQLSPVYRSPEAESDKPEHIANGFSYNVMLKAEGGVEWQEQRLVVQSFKHAQAKQKALDRRLEKAEQEIDAVNQRGRGRKRLDEKGVRTIVDDILKRHDMADLLAVEYIVETKTTHRRAYLDRPAGDVTVVMAVTVRTVRDTTAYDETVRCLGWRVFACNDPGLDLCEAVLAYREEYLIERGFNRLRGKVLGLTPLYLTSTTRIKGLVRLLCIGLRVLCLVEFTVRQALQERSEKLSGIYQGNPKRTTARPTTEMMLKAFVGISMVMVSFGMTNQRSVTSLNAVQSRILDLLGFPATIYQGLNMQSGDVGFKMSEP